MLKIPSSSESASTSSSIAEIPTSGGDADSRVVSCKRSPTLSNEAQDRLEEPIDAVSVTSGGWDGRVVGDSDADLLELLEVRAPSTALDSSSLTDHWLGNVDPVSFTFNDLDGSSLPSRTGSRSSKKTEGGP